MPVPSLALDRAIEKLVAKWNADEQEKREITKKDFMRVHNPDAILDRDTSRQRIRFRQNSFRIYTEFAVPDMPQANGHDSNSDSDIYSNDMNSEPESDSNDSIIDNSDELTAQLESSSE